MPTDTERLDWLIANTTTWNAPSTFSNTRGETIHWLGYWDDGNPNYGGGGDAITPKAADPRAAIDLAIAAETAHADKKITKIKEPVRGLVPAAGARDTTYNKFLDELKLEQADAPTGVAVRQAMHASSDVRFTTFLDMLSNPTARTGKRHMASIAKHCNISLTEFMDFVRKAYGAQVIARSMAGMLDLTEDLLSDARSKKINCERCDGMRFVWAGDDVANLSTELAQQANVRKIKGMDGTDRYIRTCPACDGAGKAAIAGDSDARKTLIEQSGMNDGKRKGAAGVTINFGGAGIESAVSRMSDVTFDIEADD